MSALPLWATFLATLALVLSAAEIGYRTGGARQKASTKEREAPVGGMVAASLGLLAFLLAFTFGFAANLFQAKREALLEEANAIGTAYLRAELLSDEARRAVRDLLREYVDVRLAAASTGDTDTAIAHSEELHASLWAEAVTAASATPTPIVGLFVQSVNEVIDMHAKRIMVSLRSQIPSTIWTALYAIAFLAFGTMGYQSGLSANRSFAILAVGIIFSAVVWLIADLDTAQQGLLRVSQQTMLDLRDTMSVP